MAEGVALIISDIQKDIVRIFGSAEECKTMIVNTRRLIDWAHAKGVPVIYSCIGFRPDYLDSREGHREELKKYNILQAQGEGGQVVDELAPQDGDFQFFRNRASGFYNTPLEIILRAVKAHTVVLAGCSTARVVESTARDAADRDFRVIVASDACSASTPEFHANALKSMGDFYAEILTTDEVTESLP